MRKSICLLFALCFSLPLAKAQERTGIAVDPSAKNIAALFTMTDEGGRLRNLDLMEGIFKDKSLGFECERHHNVSSAFIYQKITDLASKLDPGATLLLYFNSHGGGSGDRFMMTAKEGSFKFSKALEALGKSNKPIRRLIFLVDTCHAAGSIQDSLKQDGELLRNIKSASPTSFLPELPSKFSSSMLPFISVFVEPVLKTEKGRRFFEVQSEIDYGQDSGIYEEILIISSCSVEDLSMRGTFASRLASTFNSAKDNKNLTVGEFLRKFALSHGSSGQQPYYKILPDARMFGELLFGPWPAQKIPVLDHDDGTRTIQFGLIPIPSRS